MSDESPQDLLTGLVADQLKNSVAAHARLRGIDPGVRATKSRYDDVRYGGKDATVSAKSLQDYERKGLGLLNEYIEKVGGDLPVRRTAWPEALPNPLIWVNWLLSTKRPSVKSASWRLYRRCAVQVLLGWPDSHKSLDEAITMIEASRSDDTMNRADRPAPRTSAKRRKYFTANDLVSILIFLKAREVAAARGLAAPRNSRAEIAFLPGDTIDLMLQDWLVAGLATGLRPSEWRQSSVALIDSPEQGEAAPEDPTERERFLWRSIDDMLKSEFLPAWGYVKNVAAAGGFQGAIGGDIWLATFNAKHTNGRGNDDTRALNVGQASGPVRIAIMRMLIRGHWYQETGEWELVQRLAKDRLTRVNQAAFPRRRLNINLYSCRHQAMANFKAALPLFEVATLAGHAQMTSPAEFYARAGFAWDSNWQEDVIAALAGDEAALDKLKSQFIFPAMLAGRRRKRRKGGKGGGKLNQQTDQAIISAVNEALGMIRALAETSPPKPYPKELQLLATRELAKTNSPSPAQQVRPDGKDVGRRPSAPGSSPSPSFD